MANLLGGRGGDSASRRKKKCAFGTPTPEAEALKTQVAKHKARVTASGLILSVAWIASSYWTFNGLMLTAEETATAGFTGAIQAVIAGVVSAVVVAGSCSMLLSFSGEGEGHE